MRLNEARADHYRPQTSTAEIARHFSQDIALHSDEHAIYRLHLDAVCQIRNQLSGTLLKEHIHQAGSVLGLEHQLSRTETDSPI